MDLIGFFALIVVGFVASLDFSSYRFFHPVFHHLDPKSRVLIEQGLNRNIGWAMPLLMPLSILLTAAYALFRPQVDQTTVVLRWVVVAATVVSLVTTLIVNAPINSVTDKWDVNNLPGDWERVRRRWEASQAVRAWLLLVAFVLLALAVTRMTSNYA